jgi:hypothetical protein
MKSNYSPLAEQVELVWSNGLYVPAPTPSAPAAAAANNAADALFLDLLDRFTNQNQRVGPYKGPNYAPAKFADHPQGKPFGSKKLAAAMQRLLDAKAIRIETDGPTSRRITYLTRL